MMRAPAPWTLPSHAGLLTGRHPFAGDADAPAEVVIAAIRAGDYAPPQTLAPDCPPAVVRLIERALALTIDYVKERKAFGKAILDFQNTQFTLAEVKTEATIGKVFLNHCIDSHVKGGLDTVTASMAKYWLTDLQNTVVDRCLQLFGGYGYMDEYPISRMYRDARVQRIYAGTNEIMKLLISRSL